MSAHDSRLRKSGFVIAVSIMAFVLLASALATILSASAAQGQQQEMRTTLVALTSLDNLRAAVTEAELGVNNYVLSNGATGESQFQDGRARASDDARRLATLQGITPSARHDTNALLRLTPATLAGLQRVIRLEQSGQTSEAMRQLSVGSVAQETGSLRGLLTQVQDAEDESAQSQVTAAEEAQRFAATVAVVSAILDIVSLVAIVLVLRRTSALREQFAEERTRAEERARFVALEETNRQMKDFLGIASHEIRTPLTSLKIGLQLASREVRRLTEEAQQRGESDAASLASVTPLLDRALTSTGQLERLAGDLVDVTRIEANALNLRPAPNDLDLIVSDCVEEQRLYHPGRTITLSAPDSAVITLADADRIRQVLANYLINALKFSDESRPVEVRLSADAKEAEVRVRDEGPGIPPEEQSHVWEQFYRSPGIMHKSGSSEGFGLGLYICKNIIERHGGAVGVESVVGQGSTFWFTLPLANTAAEEPAPPEEAGGAPLADGANHPDDMR